MEREDLPREPVDRFMRPLRRFLRIESAAGMILLIATVIALVVANSRFSAPVSSFWETPVGLRFGGFEFSRSLRHWINDALMTLFFFVVALELKRELLAGSVRKALFPLAGAVGGMLVPPLLYLALLHGTPMARGWGTTMTTDTAFVLGGLALLGTRVPLSLRLFLLSLAIFDDVGAIVVVAIAYGEQLSWPALLIALGIVAAVLVAGRAGVRGAFPYLFAGAALWLAIDASGLHPSLAGVLLGVLTPARQWISGTRLRRIFERVSLHATEAHQRDAGERADLRTAAVAAHEAVSPVERLEFRIHPWSAFFIMPVFALANAGVWLAWERLADPVSVAIAVALVVGKPAGVLGLCWLSERTGLATRPADLSWPVIAAAAILTGIGFTMSIFIAGLAFDAATFDAAKVGILVAAVVSAVVGLGLLFVATRRPRTRPAQVRAAAGEGVVGASLR